MNSFIIVIYFTALIICLYSITYIVKNYRDYGTKLFALLIGFVLIIFGIVYSTFFIFAVLFYYSDEINVLLWKLSLLSGIGGLGIVIIIFSFLKEYKKFPIFSIIIYTILFGFIIGYIFLPNSIQIDRSFSDASPGLISDLSTINFTFNPILGIITIILDTFITVYILTLAISIHIHARDKDVSRFFVFNGFIFIMPILFYILYISFQINIFRELHYFILFINFVGFSLIIVKRPDFFLLLTNKIYDVSIYHKSGVLLYTYKFDTKEEENDSNIWGNILIGINHILMEFVDKDDQIDVFQTINKDIIVNYDNEYGFATLVLTNQKNRILEKMVQNFVDEFRTKYKDELNEITDLNKIINVSEFEDTKGIIEQNFNIYL